MDNNEFDRTKRNKLLSRQRPVMDMAQRIRPMSTKTTSKVNKPKLVVTERIRGGGVDPEKLSAAAASDGILQKIAPILSQIWFFPVVAFLIITVFVSVQVANQNASNEITDVIIPVKTSTNPERGGTIPNKQQSVNERNFFNPYNAPKRQDSNYDVLVPTTVVLSHNEPKFPELSPTLGPVSGIITIKTKTKEMEETTNDSGKSGIVYKVPFGTPTTAPCKWHAF